MRHLILLVSFASLAGCSSTSVETAALDGIWGGDHISLEASDTSSTVELDCAHGSLADPIRPGADGHFTVRGTFVLEHGGPYREDEVEDVHPARYSGQVKGDRMSLTIELTDLAMPVLSYSLTRGEAGRLFKCL